ncbi:MAG: EAL domain-containing protein [Rhizobiaceae bacterium]
MTGIFQSNNLPSDSSSPLHVAVITEDSSTRRLLTERKDFNVTEQGVSAWAAGSIDLAIVDLPALKRHELEIRRWRNLPPSEQVSILLIVSEDDIETPEALLGDLVDDLLRTPISEAELRARAHSLLRFRNRPETRNLEIVPAELEHKGVARALQASNAGNDRTIRACSEQDILTDICKSLTCEGGYPLAWIGQRLNDTDKTIKPVAVSGNFSDLVPRVFSDVDQDAVSSSAMAECFETGILSQSLLPEPSYIGGTRPTREAARPRAVIVFPLTQHDEQPSTCLAIYNSEPELFDDSELDLLQRFIDNALRGIYSLREKFSHRRREREALRIAYRDSLTGLSNRTALLRALDLRLQKPSPYPPTTALLYIDLDGFKLINDALGHAAGDSMLIDVGHRLESKAREFDLVTRHGGDEFVILMPLDGPQSPSPTPYEHALGQASSIADEILNELQKPFQILGKEHHIESSIGIGMCPAHAQDAFGLLMKAEDAMFEAKKIGGNSFELYSIDLSVRRQQRLALENRLYHSVENREFEIALQPIVDLTDGRIIAAEALLRWPQADGTYISPAEFIPIAEESGFIVTIGDWVMEESLRALKRVRVHGFTDLQITVNLAIAQLWQHNLVEKTVKLMDSLGLPPSALKVELTEGSLMHDVDRMEGVVEEFRAAGIEVAIDDFGTGYSSLARLKSLPITTLKIDRGFLNGVPEDENAVSVVTTIAQMANNLGIESIAEGIETEAQWHLLRDLGCPLGQGFYFARPMKESDLLALLMNH